MKTKSTMKAKSTKKSPPVEEAPAAEAPAEAAPTSSVEGASMAAAADMNEGAHLAATPGAHPARGGSGAGSIRRLYTVPERMTPAERDRQAKEEFERAVSPVTDLLCQAVPEAGTPEEAGRLLAERQGEYIPDPDGGAYIPGDAYGEDRRVYYRLLHRDYHPNPRPRGKRVSHRLQDRPQLLPGTRGW